MYKPVLSIDVSKSKSVAAAFSSYEEPLSKTFSFSHSPKGTDLLMKHLKELELKTGVKPEVVLEATGNYSKPITDFFQRSGYNVVVLNPIMTHLQKAKSVRKIKTDPVDVDRIAKVYYLNKVDANYDVPDYIAELQCLSRQYEGLMRTYTEIQLRMQSILDLVFPNYHTVFSHVCCNSSLMILMSYPAPDDILKANTKDLFKIIKSSARGHSDDWCNTKVQQLLAAAGESLPSHKAQQSNTRVLKDYLRILMTQKQILTDIRAHLISRASLSPAYALLLSIPGIGELTAATILSEIGQVNRFPTEKQLVAFAGLDPSVFQSGKFKSTNNRISKRGSSYLRKALYQATIGAISKRKNGSANPVLFEFYTKKRSEGKSPKVAIIATSGKLLRIIYGILTSQKPFSKEH